jgi:hypothetical protein
MEGFVQFYLQMSMLIHSRPPRELTGLPPVESLKGMTKLFEHGCKAKGETATLF